MSDTERALRDALMAARTELARWGWGDFHYGSQPQERSVVAALAVIDSALALPPIFADDGVDAALDRERAGIAQEPRR